MRLHLISYFYWEWLRFIFYVIWILVGFLFFWIKFLAHRKFFSACSFLTFFLFPLLSILTLRSWFITATPFAKQHEHLIAQIFGFYPVFMSFENALANGKFILIIGFFFYLLLLMPLYCSILKWEKYFFFIWFGFALVFGFLISHFFYQSPNYTLMTLIRGSLFALFYALLSLASQKILGPILSVTKRLQNESIS